VTLRAVRTSSSLEDVARTLVEKAQHRSGFRSMVSAARAGGDTGRVPAELARQLSRLNRQVILLECGQDGADAAGDHGAKPRRGLTDVLAGTATFEDVIAPLPGSSVHTISAGSAIGQSAAADRDRINMLLDALDEVYDHIVITGAWHDLRELFKTIQGCIDAGIIVSAPGSETASGDFLGYNVHDLDVVRFETDELATSAHQDLGAFVPTGAAL
jgi:Mrp family chromosome partitioning ATPase